ncbi:MAG: hypothetical protein QOF77_729 [Solirubrobacteraceae bacterium]|jgi:hypothetical protein|nr:hypothetical protein [Solirubrobacteraceae bacterium]
MFVSAVVVALAAAAGSAVAAPAAPARGAAAPGPLRHLGTVDLRQLAGAPTPQHQAQAVLSPYELGGVEIPKSPFGGRPDVVPNPAPIPVTADPLTNLAGFDGISHRDQRLADNGNQQSLEPPDQGLCVGSGHVIEAVNTALTIRAADSFAVEVPTIALSTFFGLPHAVNRQTHPITVGPFLSDPRCYFDVQTQRFYVTVLEIDRDPATGALGTHAATLLAVSQTSDPTGAWGLFAIDATDDGSNGTPVHANCPCFGDQPVIGADANGFYFSTNEYSLHPFGTFFDGAQIYALSKRGLAAAALSPSSALPALVHLEAGNLGMSFPPVEGIPAAIASVQPARTPPGAAYARDAEYLLSSFDVNVNKSDKRLALWALTNTHTLDTPAPALRLTAKILGVEPYAGGPPAGTPVVQRPGPRPLGDALGEPLPTVNADDDRMQAPTYVNGLLYAALSTGIGAANNVTRTGIAWFVLAPYTVTGQVGGVVANQGYAAAPDTTSLMYPAVGMNRSGRGVIALSLTGPSDYPSFGYLPFSAGGPLGTVHVVRPGVAPEDGFTCYVNEGFGPPCRWGDYSAAESDEAGNLWMAGEDIPGPRTVLANWGTFVARLGRGLTAP